MFTGIVRAMGEIIERDQTGLIIQSPTGFRVSAGDSIAVDGVCLTVSKVKRGRWRFEVMSETLKKTTIGHRAIARWRARPGDQVNLERALKVGDEIGGHFVYGHVDGVGEVLSTPRTRRGAPPFAKGGAGWWIKIKPSAKLMKYIVPQGSIAIDGVSLTVARVGKSNFTVSLVPYTLKHTTLGSLKKGDKVNIEVDMMAKYLDRIKNN